MGNFAISIIMASLISASDSISTELGLKAISAEVKEDKTPMGWAALGKLFKIVFKSSSTKESLRISSVNRFNSFGVGNSPKINKKGEIEGYEDEYNEYTAYADEDGKMKDVQDGIEESTKDDGIYSKEELEQLIVEQIENDLKKGKK